MASFGHRRRKADDPNLAEQRGAHFLKTILQSNVRDRKLLIPRKFVRDSAGGLLKWKSATLEVVDGEKWEVGLVTDGREDVWFGSHGWENFAQYYSLEYGHTLFFTYSGRSTFSVVVINRTGAEIDYPVSDNVGIEVETTTTTNQMNRDSSNKSKSPLMANDDDDDSDSQMKQKKSCKMVLQMLQEQKRGSKGEVASEKPSSSSRKKRRAH